jgi:hypothetical protein
LDVLVVKGAMQCPHLIGASARPWRAIQAGERAWGFKGTRTPAAVVSENLEGGMTIDEVAEQFPVTREQVKAVLEFAARMQIALG